MKTFYERLNLSSEASPEEIKNTWDNRPEGIGHDEFYDIYFYLYDEVNQKEYNKLLTEESDAVIEEFHQFLNQEFRESEEKYSDDVAKSDSIVSAGKALIDKLTSPMGYLLYFLGEAHWKRNEDELSQSYFKRLLELYPNDSEVQAYCENQSMADPTEKQENEEYILGEIKRRPTSFDLVIQLARHHFIYREYEKAESLLDSELYKMELTSATAIKWFSFSVLRASFFHKKGESNKGNEVLQKIYTSSESLEPFPKEGVAEVIAFLKREGDEEWEEKFKELYEKNTSVKSKNRVTAIVVLVIIIVLHILLKMMN